MYAIAYSLLVTLQAAAGSSPAGIMNQRDYSFSVPIVQNGVGCTIVYPAADPAWRDLASQLSSQLKELGGRAPSMISDTEAITERLGRLPASLQAKPLILLGDLNSNRAIFPFYANYYTYCDASYPGPGGYIVQTVVRPFGAPNNVLIVGAATVEDARLGVRHLLARMADLEPAPHVELPYCLDVKLGARLQAIIQPVVDAALAQDPAPQAWTTAPADPPASQPEDLIDYGQARDRFMNYAHLYFYTGRLELAERSRDWGDYIAARESGIRIADYTMENLAAAWRRVSPAPVFTPEQRQRLDTRMYETAVKNADSWWRQKGAIPEIGGRHHTTGMLAWWSLLRCVLEVGQPDAAAQAQLLQWRDEAEGYLDGLLRHYWDDLDDYQSADSAQNTASYALQTGKLAWYHDGMAKRAAEKLLSLTDNLGWYVGVQGYGEALPGWERFTLNGGLLLGSCGFIYDDGGYRWILDRFPGLSSSWGALQPWQLHQYATTSTANSQQPEWLTGMQILRLTPYRVDLLNRGVFLNSPLMDGFAVAGVRAPAIADDLAYDKVVMRSSAAADGLFLLLQGMSGIALSTIDMNSIIRYTDAGKLWLVHNTGRMSLFFKNAVYISNGLNDEPVPAACELVALAEAGDMRILSSRLPGYRGTDWTRNVLSWGDRFAVIIDQVEARKPAEYFVSCNWRTPGWAQIEENGWLARQDDATFHLLPGEMTGMESKRFDSGDGATRPTVLRQQRRFKAIPGESVFFENLLYTSSSRKQQKCEVRRIAPGVLAIRVTDAAAEQTIIAFAKTAGLDLPGLKTDATCGLISTNSVVLANATYAQFASLSHKQNVRGQMQLKPANSADLAELISNAWAAAHKPNSTELNDSTESATTNRCPSPIWTHPGPSTRGPLIDGLQITHTRNLNGPTLLTTDWMLPTLVAEPKLSPQGGSGLSFEAAKHMQRAGDASSASDLQAVLDPLPGAEFTINLPRKTTVGELLLIGATGGEVATPMPPASLTVELTFTKDGFAQDLRTRRLTIGRHTQYHTLYKGHAYAFEAYLADNLNEPASAIRVHFIDGPSNQMAINDIQIRSADATGIQPTQLRLLDLDADGNDELMSWAPHGQFVLLDNQGKQLWRRDFGAGIVAVDAWDLETDGRKEIFVSLTNWDIIALNLDGSPRWQVNWADMKRKTDGKFYSDGSIIYGMGAWQRQGRPDKEVLLTGYYFAAHLDSRGKLTHNFRRSGHVTQMREIPAGLPNAGALVTRSDIPWTGPVPLEWLDPVTGNASISINVPNGPAVLVEVDDFDRDKQPEAIVATEQGIGLYSPREPNRRWEHLTEAALTGAEVITGAPGEPARFIYCRQDGYLFVVDNQGQVLQQHLLDEPIHCLTLAPGIDGMPVAVIGTTNTLRCLRLTDWHELWRRPGKYQSLSALRHEQSTAVVGNTRSGEISCLSLR